MFVKGLIKARTNARNIADIPFERTGIYFPTQSVQNLINKVKYIEVLPFYIFFYLNVCMCLFSMFLHIALTKLIQLICIASQYEIV